MNLLEPFAAEAALTGLQSPSNIESLVMVKNKFPTLYEAQQALELVVHYFECQLTGLHESERMVLGSIMEKLSLSEMH